MKKVKRKVEVVVISDVHLGTYGCHAKELLQYLKSIKPEKLILNGDIIDIWQFNKRYWPSSHMQVIKHITGLIAKGTKVVYVTGNHDEMLRKFSGFKMNSFKIVNKVVLNLDGRKAWIFHGDVFDVTMQHSKWLAKLGAIGYDLLILINRFVNFCSNKLGRGKISLSKRIKNSVKSAVKFINNFEETAAEIGISNSYDFVICGHIHQPEIREISNSKGRITYLNSGDWVENLTALEYNNGEWSIYRYNEDAFAKSVDLSESQLVTLNDEQLFENLMQEFNILR
ncbi:MAG: UDP-2,3-diacylglucosamine diphosphatase [Bacteroidetes bacterium]|nr:UDP-2,3-diacylglucosamine diphosphatase [Bacteroidota bacterium]